MDADRFDAITRSLFRSRSRRDAVASLLGSSVGMLGWVDAQDAAAKNCKKIKNKKKRKKCLAKAKAATCGSVTCAEGQVCCPDKRCGRTCCANGRACNVTCCGPNGNDFCCDASRPMCICGGCWQAGSVQCDDPKHCCGPLSPRCCGNDHCCADGWECLVDCPGNTCCKGGQSPTCCPLGHRPD